MAETKKAGGKPVLKKSIKLGDKGELKIKVGKAKKADGKNKPKKGKGKDHSALESLARLAESPLVADLIAVGATAAVAALAGSKKRDGKSAAKAAAAAIGTRLMSEFNSLKDSAKDAAKDSKKA